jgi:hypothetical protein
MLRTQSLFQARLQSVSVNATRAFERHVWQNPEICNNCFSRCKQIYTDQHQTSLAGDGTDVEAHYRTSEGSIGYDVEDIDEYGARKIHRPKTTCENCGSVRLLAHEDTLSQREALERVDDLAARLVEQDIPVNVDVLRRAVRQLKGHEALAGRDRDIFERATKLAIQHAQS